MRILLAVAALAAFPASAHALIVPGVGIKGAKLGMSKGQVRAVLGNPEYKVANGAAVYWVWGQPPREFRVQFDSRGVYGFYLTRRGQRTKEGVGVGSTRKAVDRVPGTRCRPSSCEIRHKRRGSYTNFSLDRGRVVGITIALNP